jgi:hypothetical protein
MNGVKAFGLFLVAAAASGGLLLEAWGDLLFDAAKQTVVRLGPGSPPLVISTPTTACNWPVVVPLAAVILLGLVCLLLPVRRSSAAELPAKSTSRKALVP